MFCSSCCRGRHLCNACMCAMRTSSILADNPSCPTTPQKNKKIITTSLWLQREEHPPPLALARPTLCTGGGFLLQACDESKHAHWLIAARFFLPTTRKAERSVRSMASVIASQLLAIVRHSLPHFPICGNRKKLFKI